MRKPLRLLAAPALTGAGLVFRVGPFKDDAAIRVTRENGGSALHLRSAGRVGYSDFGVNGRRVRRFLEALTERLAEVQ